MDQPKALAPAVSALDMLVQQGQLKASLSTNSNNRRATQTEWSRGEIPGTAIQSDDSARQSRTESKVLKKNIFHYPYIQKADLLSTMSREGSGNSITEEAAKKFVDKIAFLESELKRFNSSPPIFLF
jgi:hypothetical protein